MQLTKAQTLAVASIEENILVAAGAGSGKTHVLVERIIENLRQSKDLKVSQLMAVTFTRKAAEEMRVRLKSRIKEMIVQANENERKRWQTAFGEIDTAHIGTIHSLCQSILRNFPIESRVDPQFETFDDEDAEQAELIDAAINEAFRDLLSNRSEAHDVLLKYPLEDIAKWLTKVMKSPLQFDESIDACDFSSKEAFLEEVQRQLKRAQEQGLSDLVQNQDWIAATVRLRAQALLDPENKLELMRLELLERIEQINRSSDDISVKWSSLRVICDITLKSGGHSDEAKTVRATLGDLRELAKKHSADLPEAVGELDLQDFELLKSLMLMVQTTRTIYEREKNKIQKMDFNDLIGLTFKAVIGPGSRIQAFYQASLKEILVDEFQDTNRIQARLIAALAGPDTRLFLIGDDKQSIYKFQGADVSTFNEWREYFRLPADQASSNGMQVFGTRRVLSLGESFRSHPKIVEFVNGVFAKLLNEPGGAKYRASYGPLQPFREASDPQQRVEVVSFEPASQTSDTPSDMLRLSESECVADWILEKVVSAAPVVEKDKSVRPITFGDFAILAARNEDFSLLEPALAARNIPYVTIGGRTFLNRQEVYDIENVLTFLDNPSDDHALLGVLRSPICSLSDDLLHRLGTEGTDTLWNKLRHESESRRDGHHLVSRAYQFLKKLLEEMFSKTLAELVTAIITQSLYDLVLMATPDGQQRSRNLWKLADLAGKNEHMSCGQFARHLNNMRVLEVKQQNAPLETSNAVKLMTIHRSKGLEFPAVLLPALHAKVNKGSSKLIFHHQYGVALDTTRSKSEEKPLWYKLGARTDKDMEISERKRLLYVAMTRARDYLGICIGDVEQSGESFARWLTELLGLDSSDGTEGDQVRTVPASNATFVLRRWSGSQRSRGSHPGSQALASGSKGADEKAMKKLDLLDPITSDLLAPPSEWIGQHRITAENADLHLHPTVSGNFFHLLMENMPEDLSPLSEQQVEVIALSLGAVAALPTVRKTLVKTGSLLLSKFAQSELFQIMKNAKKLLREVPFYKVQESADTTERPDLLLERSDSTWLLVDFKTDRFDLANIDQQAKSHYAQLKRYQDDLANITGIKAHVAVYFAQHGVLHKFAP
jgi:ATP-dependent helicase/nuclease subunit A